MQALFIATF